MRRHLRSFVVAALALAWVGSSASWCLCAVPEAAPASAHACCDEGAGLLPGEDHCCAAAPAPARLELGLRTAPPVLATAAPGLVERSHAFVPPPPVRPGGRSPSPAVILRV
jgi:hypothetical protein